MLKLMQPTPFLPPEHPLLNYHYSDSEQWTAAETEAFHEAVARHDKDFYSVAAHVSTKSVKQCVQFYYVWKKVCTDEYRRLRVARAAGVNAPPTAEGCEVRLPPGAQASTAVGVAHAADHAAASEQRSFTCDYSDCSAVSSFM